MENSETSTPLSEELTEQERRKRLHLAYSHILSLRPRQGNSQGDLANAHPVSVSARVSDSTDEDTEDNTADWPDKQIGCP
jgi:hypothetical protein